jgi:SAM-dependent methyltransferase
MSSSTEMRQVVPNAGKRYNELGSSYRRTRRPDDRIAGRIEEALGDCVTIVNVGAGAGSYESRHRRVVALEPSRVMIRQRPRDGAPPVMGRAEALPFRDASVDATTAFLTVHHWAEQESGLREMRRVARSRVVILTYVPAAIDPTDCWLTRVYFPPIGARLDAMFPGPAVYQAALGPCDFVTVPVPADCTDGFLDAYWARPERYLDAEVRSGIFWLQELDAHVLDQGLRRLDRDLRDGAWEARFGHLRSRSEFDAGLRLVCAKGSTNSMTPFSGGK